MSINSGPINSGPINGLAEGVEPPVLATLDDLGPPRRGAAGYVGLAAARRAFGG